MTKLDLQYDIINLSPADANPLESNFTRTEQFVNQELIERDGTVAMRAQLKLVGDPINALDAAPKQYVDQILPIGIIMMFGGVGSPPGGRWAECNGAELQTAAYPDLSTVLGTRYVTGTVSTGRFNLPNLNGRFPMGTTATDAVGTTGGARDMPIANHTHPIPHSHAGTTDNQNSFHYHDGVDHLHGVSIQSGTESSYHEHAGLSYETVQFTPSPGFYLSTEPPNGLLGAGVINPANYPTGSQNRFHTHAVNGATGAADRSLNTSQERGWHQHTYTTPAYSGDSANPAGGVAAANANLPPYTTITYIIRIL